MESIGVGLRETTVAKHSQYVRPPFTFGIIFFLISSLTIQIS